MIDPSYQDHCNANFGPEDIDDLPDAPASPIDALIDLYEWYDRDGSVGGASEVFEKHRSVVSRTVKIWQPIATAPTDGSEILILTSIGVTQARFGAGEWHNHHEGREYDGPVWVCCDDQWQIEIEDCGKDGMHHGMATHWMPMPADPVSRPATTSLQGTENKEAGA